MTTPLAADLPYLLRRAEQEAIAAIAADNTAAAPAHHKMSQHYSALALRALAEHKLLTASDT